MKKNVKWAKFHLGRSNQHFDKILLSLASFEWNEADKIWNPKKTTTDNLQNISHENLDIIQFFKSLASMYLWYLIFLVWQINF